MHSITVYTVRVHDQTLAGPVDERYAILDSVRGIDLCDAFHDFARAIEGQYERIIEDRVSKAFGTANLGRDGRTIFGETESGDFGARGKIVDVDSGNVVHPKTVRESDIASLYFQITIPAGARTGLAFFMSRGVHGAKSLFASRFNDYVRPRIGDLTVQFRPLTPERAVRDWYDQAIIKELRLASYTAQSAVTDVADTLGEHTTELVFRAKRQSSLGNLRDFFRRGQAQAQHSNVVEIMGGACGEIKAVAKLGDSTRTFALTSNSEPVSAIELTEDEVEMDGGVPTLASTRQFVDGLAEEIFATL